MVVVRKNISCEQGEQRLFDEIRYCFYVTNDGATAAAEVVFLANARQGSRPGCAPEKRGTHPTYKPVSASRSMTAVKFFMVDSCSFGTIL